MSKSVKYSCEKCAKTFSQKSHYDQHINRKKLCDNQTDKIQALIDKSVEEKVNELNKKLILNNTSISNDITHNTIMEDTKTEPIVSDIEVKNIDGLQYLSTIKDGTVDLILTDPPYIISKDSGMNTHYNKVKHNEANHIEFVKTEEEWLKYKTENNMLDDVKKENYMKYGTIYGKKYCVKTDYGEWDSEFTMEILEKFIGEYYKKLKNGGTIIIFFDLWKISFLKEIMEKHKFKQIRFIEWIKTNPQPLNSSVNYLTNCREIALLGIKGTKPTFNSKYDNGIYMFPLQGGKNRFHPTQKSLSLFEELIKKHSKENDVVLDTFLGGGTTAIASKNTKRKFKGCEISTEYFDKVIKLI
uniref:C2H2-type domain-containing protein n=1 Tax=viral metagenome TaxID=1070528 RepID=A0A6C0HP30_9ZZZZ